VSIPLLSHVFEEGVCVWYNLDTGGSIEATITMQCRRQYAPGRCAEAVIEVIQAENLQQIQFLSEQDPYVRVTVLDCAAIGVGSGNQDDSNTASQERKVSIGDASSIGLEEGVENGAGTQPKASRQRSTAYSQEWCKTHEDFVADVSSDTACTEVKRSGGTAPVWRKTLRLRAGRLSRSLRLEVWIKNGMLLADELIGSRDVPFDHKMLQVRAAIFPPRACTYETSSRRRSSGCG
jgi:hypothetical protein